MILEHGKDPVSAKWCEDTSSWDIGEKKKYRWIDNAKTPHSEWFYDISDALTWIKAHDSKTI